MKFFSISKSIILIIVILLTILSGIKVYKVFIRNTDVTIFGAINQADGIGRQAIDLIKLYANNKLNINFIGKINSESDLDSGVKKILGEKNYKIGKVFINTNFLHEKLPVDRKIYKILSKINPISRNKQIWFSYTMFESDAIMSYWVKQLNERYDAVIIPDENIKETYVNSGVRIPIFVLPLSVYLDDFLTAPLKTKANKVFTFGNFSSIEDRKNTLKLVQSFHIAFGNNPSFKLIIDAHRGNYDYEKKVLSYIDDNKIGNIVIKTNHKKSTSEYLSLFQEIDCYVSFSKGEGFSVQPREAMAMGIPVIVTDAFAQKTIADSGLVRVVKANQKKMALYDSDVIGNNSDFDLNDGVEALKDMHKNYQYYLDKSSSARNWAMQYTYQSLRPYYLSLVKPNNVVLGKENIITKDYIETNSETLYKKYKELK